MDNGLQIGVVAAEVTVALVSAVVAIGYTVTQLFAWQAEIVALELVL